MLDQIQFKICNRCKQEFPFTLNYFYRHTKSRFGLRGHCKECQNKATNKNRLEHLGRAVETQRRHYKRNSAKILKRNQQWRAKYPKKVQESKRRDYLKNVRQEILRQAKLSAKRKGLEFSITLEDIVIPSVCPVLGIPIEPNVVKGKRHDGSRSIDRIDNQKGYIPGNVWVISWRANWIKSNASLDELRMLVKALECKLSI